MGKWKNAPVVYVIVQVRYSPVLSLKTYVPQIQENFRRNGFPAFDSRFNFQLAFSIPPPPEPEPAEPAIPLARTLSYMFSNRDRSQSFVLEENGLTLHVTDYLDFSWFLDLFLTHLEHIHGVISPDSSERIGLRYIDAVLPKPGSEVKEYLIPAVLGLSEQPVEGSVQHSYSETMLLNGNTSTISRIIARSGKIAFPPDMVGLPVQINSRFTEYEGTHALVDTDSFQTTRSPMEIQKLRDTLHQLHESVENAFDAVTTDFARADWKQEKP
ncbi:MAG: TIGR04255 family protein [Terracidiphilus sp.]|nr:TIGR04255 family protein [Terracidiphilus sp.]MDR3797162.1 TIGR04255 family protein [Terracidiphilus sp.]